MSDLKTKAYALAEATPPHLGRPTTPPITWRQVGDELVVILADGRKLRGPITQSQPKVWASLTPNVPPSPILAKTDKDKPLPSTPSPKTTIRPKQLSRHKQANRKA